MTHKETAEAYVREKRPELVTYQKVGWVCSTDCDWSCGKCKAGEKNVPNSSIPKDLICPQCKENGDFVGHPINLQDWLGVLDNMLYIVDGMGNLYLLKMMMNWKVPKITDDPLLKFNMETGQPATEADYQAFNEIVT